MIQVVPYDFAWPVQFQEQAERIENVLKENCLQVYHVGSTSVPGLCAKPKIDILAVVKNPFVIINKLKKIDYEFRGEVNIPFHFYFTKKERIPEVNLHVYEEGHPEIKLNLLFRDYIRASPLALKEYATLKLNLVQQEAMHKKLGERFSGYTLGKDTFIKKILLQAGFNEICIRFCVHHEEWQAVKRLRQQYFLDQKKNDDSEAWTFNHKDHVHFVLYKGIEILGYAHLEIQPGYKAILKCMSIGHVKQHKEIDLYFLQKIKEWLNRKSVQNLLI